MEDVIEDQRPASGHGRWRRSAATLGTTRSALPAALAGAAGVPAPAGRLADELIVQALDVLDALVPIGAVTLENDLLDAAKDLGYESLPPIPDQILSAQSRIADSVSRLAAGELDRAATQLGLPPSTVEWGARVTTVRQNKQVRQEAARLLAEVDFDEAGYPDADVDEPESDFDDFEDTVAAVVEGLRTEQPADWAPALIESLRCAVAIHLAQIGDGFLRTSEGQP
jgi:hypothetical protein